jgi:hypothetical protein
MSFIDDTPLTSIVNPTSAHMTPAVLWGEGTAALRRGSF